MMNINSIFIAPKIKEISSISIPWLSILFVFNSIYNILDYLCINNNQIKQINSLQESLNKTNKKCDELQKKYDNLHINFEKLNEKINLLNIKNDESQDTKIDELNIDTSIVYRELCELSNHNDITTKEIKSPNSEDINHEFIESLSLDYDFNENTDSEKKMIDTHNCVRTRSTSLTEYNWTSLTKKFLFG